MMLREDKVWILFYQQKAIETEQNDVIWQDLLLLLETRVLIVHFGEDIATYL